MRGGYERGEARRRRGDRSLVRSEAAEPWSAELGASEARSAEASANAARNGEHRANAGRNAEHREIHLKRAAPDKWRLNCINICLDNTQGRGPFSLNS
jgi:hypothetical protein